MPAGKSGAAVGANPQIAVLITCHNRRELTLRCLERLAGQAHFDPANLFLVDDGSQDGTGDAVLARMPQAHVVRGDGSLFWNGGMRLAWDAAKTAGRTFDFYLWLNDDVELAGDALAMLVADADQVVARGEPVIVAGATADPVAGTVNYGAHRRPDPRRPLRMGLVQPEGRPVPVDTVSGNVVLVSAAAEALLGNMSPAFTHIYGDLDYGLRAKAAGVPVLLASRTAGTCGSNPETGTSLDPALSKWQRLRRRWREADKLHAQDWRRFVRLHGGGPLVSLAHRAAPYLRILLDRPNRHAGGLAGGGQAV